MKQLYRSLRAAMIEAGYDQSSFAKVMGFPVRTLSNKINGHTDWTLREAYKALEILGRDAADIHTLFPPEGHDRKNIRAAQMCENVFIMPSRRGVDNEQNVRG